MSIRDELNESQQLKFHLQTVYLKVAVNNGIDINKVQFKNFIEDVYSMCIENQLCSLGYMIHQVYPKINEEQAVGLIFKIFSEVMKECYLKSVIKGATNEENFMPALLLGHWMCLAGEERDYNAKRYVGTTSDDGGSDDGIFATILDITNRKH